mmetsp:Transcript_32689/g.33022  ORF Transcript_32689/g.33022 Transcript_32689/m.33022 type:complete len:190 (-) Transcript_32689:188-757(-)
MTYQTTKTTLLSNEADSNLSKEESSRLTWLGAVTSALLFGGGMMLVPSSSSSSNVDPVVIRSESSLEKGSSVAGSDVDVGCDNDCILCSELPMGYHGGHTPGYEPAYIWQGCTGGASWSNDPDGDNIYGVGWYCNDSPDLTGKYCTKAWICDSCKDKAGDVNFDFDNNYWQCNECCYPSNPPKPFTIDC